MIGGNEFRNIIITKGIQNIAAAWNEVRLSCMSGVWRNLWPNVVEAASSRVRAEDATIIGIFDVLFYNISVVRSMIIDELEEFVVTDNAPIINDDLMLSLITSKQLETSEETLNNSNVLIVQITTYKYFTIFL